MHTYIHTCAAGWLTALNKEEVFTYIHAIGSYVRHRIHACIHTYIYTCVAGWLTALNKEEFYAQIAWPGKNNIYTYVHTYIHAKHT